uniref:t-SNARE coiled-coil homology domain-containing protein n=1 Tax=Sexangularia sp. CB-2014 TaxID=1486929 RepID=A0A7S1VQX5_9EUKA|mmetsp:Transcript_82/g.233  ORF Transcript_82/g.233 Transcript_82/m.233 type:complete len:350 (+) Transcript_82:54-1103(+)
MVLLPYTDKTNEFESALRLAVASLRGPPPVYVAAQPNTATTGSFSERASDISRRLVEVYDKLATLTELAKSTNMSFDPAEDIERLSSTITMDVETLRNAVTRLQKEGERSQSSKQEAGHSDVIVKTLNSRLLDIRSSFVQVLEKRKANLKKSLQVRQELFGNTRKAKKSRGGGSESRSLLEHDMNAALGAPAGSSSLGGAGDLSLTPYGGGGSRRRTNNPLYAAAADDNDDAGGLAAGDGLSGMEMGRSSMLMVTDDSLLDQRAVALDHIQKTIEELGQIFENINVMVAQQGEAIERISDNVEDVSANVDSAQDQLTKFYANLKQGRWLYAKIFMIMLVFIVVWLTFFA